MKDWASKLEIFLEMNNENVEIAKAIVKMTVITACRWKSVTRK